MARPHHVPLIFQPSARHARRIRKRLAIGTSPPMDLSGSDVQREYKANAVEKMLKMPTMAAAVATPAAQGRGKLFSWRTRMRRGVSIGSVGVAVGCNISSADCIVRCLCTGWRKHNMVARETLLRSPVHLFLSTHWRIHYGV